MIETVATGEKVLKLPNANLIRVSYEESSGQKHHKRSGTCGRNDTVKVISGTDKGKGEGRVLRVFPERAKILVEGTWMLW